MGSGTTALACALEGRRFVGIELDPEAFARAVKICEIQQSV
jgi:DNA modification methylase